MFSGVLEMERWFEMVVWLLKCLNVVTKNIINIYFNPSDIQISS